MLSIAAILLMIVPTVPRIGAEEVNELNVGVDFEPDVLNPFVTTSGASSEVTEKIYETLIFVRSDGTYMPWLAESWDISDDAKTYTFSLYHNITWQDGEPLTAEDVKYTFDMLVENELEPSTVRELESTEVLDDYTVRFHCKTGFVPFFMRAGETEIVPKHIWEKVDDIVMFTNNDNPIGSGPYLLDKWVKGEYWTLKVYDNYWRGRPEIDKVNYILYRSTDAMTLAMKAGEIDVGRIRPTQVGSYVGTPNVTITQLKTNSQYYFGYNLRRFPFSNKKFRHAMNYAIDKKEVLNSAFFGYGDVGYDGYVPPLLSYWINPDTAWEALGMTAEERYAKAREILDSIDFIDRDGDGIREAPDVNKCEFEMLVASGVPTYMRTAEIIKDCLSDVGVKVDLIPKEIGALITDVYGLGEEYEPDFDSYLMDCGYILEPDYLYMEYFSNPPVIGWNGYSGGYSNSTLDEYLVKQRTTGDIAKRREHLFKCQEIIAEDLPVICLSHRISLTAYRTDKYTGWITDEDLTSKINYLNLEVIKPIEIIKEVEVPVNVTKEVEVPVEVTKEVPVTPGWVYPTVGVFAALAIVAVIYAITRKR